MLHLPESEGMGFRQNGHDTGGRSGSAHTSAPPPCGRCDSEQRVSVLTKSVRRRTITTEKSREKDCGWSGG